MGKPTEEMGKLIPLYLLKNIRSLFRLGGPVKTFAIKYKDPRKLKPRPKNPRTHTPRQIKQIAASIKSLASSIRF